MKNTFVLLFTVLSALYYWQTSTAKDTEISVIPTAGRHIIISAKANGIEGRFIFGTGAETHLLTKTLTDKIDSLDKTHHFLAGHRAIGKDLQVNLCNFALFEVARYKVNKGVFAVLSHRLSSGRAEVANSF